MKHLPAGLLALAASMALAITGLLLRGPTGEPGAWVWLGVFPGMALARLLVPRAATDERWALGLALSPFAAALAARALAPLTGDEVALARIVAIGGWVLFAGGEARGGEPDSRTEVPAAALALTFAIAVAAGAGAAVGVSAPSSSGLAGGASAETLRGALHPGAGRVTAVLLAAAATGAGAWIAAGLARLAGGGARAMAIAIGLVALVSIARIVLTPSAPPALEAWAALLAVPWALARGRGTDSPRWLLVAAAGALAVSLGSPALLPPLAAGVLAGIAITMLRAALFPGQDAGGDAAAWGAGGSAFALASLGPWASPATRPDAAWFVAALLAVTAAAALAPRPR